MPIPLANFLIKMCGLLLTISSTLAMFSDARLREDVQNEPCLNFFFPVFEYSNSASNCADRQCLFPFYIHQLLVDLSRISAIFPRSENKVSLVLTVHFLPVGLLWFTKMVSRQWNNEFSIYFFSSVTYAFDGYYHF